MENPIQSAGEAVTETPVKKVNRLGWELAHALDEYADGDWKAVVYPTSVRPTFAVGFCVLDLPGIKDPLIDAIQAYRDGVARMDAITNEEITRENEERLVSETYGPHLDKLLTWDKPALTREGAIAALKFMEDQHVFVDDLGKIMRLAVLRYLEGQEGVQ